LALLPGVARARAEIVCCDQGRAIVYVGIEETGATTMHFRAAPLGAERLAADIVQSGEEFSKAFMIAVQRGDTEEDRSEGHAFARDLRLGRFSATTRTCAKQWDIGSRIRG
jgi:hypothetical protein